MSEKASRLETLQFKPNGLHSQQLFPGVNPPRRRDGERGRQSRRRNRSDVPAHDWLNNWRELGVYDYYHFHSTSHEALGMARGHITLRVGGKGGSIVKLTAGDVLILPAGTSHIRVEHSDDSEMVGGYPDGRNWDLIRDELLTEAESRAAVKLIGSLPIPAP